MKYSFASLSVIAAITLSARGVTLPFLGGINTAGYDFTVATDGSFTGTGIDPPVSQYRHFASQGANLFRIPFAWQLMTPTLGGTIDATFFKRYDASVQAALSAPGSPYVIVDLHNYARWNGAIIGQGGPTNAQFISIWTQLAAKYAKHQKVIFGIMNEPHNLNVQTWVNTVQAVVNAIRAVAPNNFLLLPGSTYSAAGNFPYEAGPLLVKVTNPSGNKDNLIFDIHQYLDHDSSGTHNECVHDGTSGLQGVVNFLRKNGNRQAILSETGGGHTSSCYTDLKAELAFVKNNRDILSFSVWSAGAFHDTYSLGLSPQPDGSDKQLWSQAVVPNLP